MVSGYGFDRFGLKHMLAVTMAQSTITATAPAVYSPIRYYKQSVVETLDRQFTDTTMRDNGCPQLQLGR